MLVMANVGDCVAERPGIVMERSICTEGGGRTMKVEVDDDVKPYRLGDVGIVDGQVPPYPLCIAAARTLSSHGQLICVR